MWLYMDEGGCMDTAYGCIGTQVDDAVDTADAGGSKLTRAEAWGGGGGGWRPVDAGGGRWRPMEACGGGRTRFKGRGRRWMRTDKGGGGWFWTRGDAG